MTKDGDYDRQKERHGLPGLRVALEYGLDPFAPLHTPELLARRLALSRMEVDQAERDRLRPKPSVIPDSMRWPQGKASTPNQRRDSHAGFQRSSSVASSDTSELRMTEIGSPFGVGSRYRIEAYGSAKASDIQTNRLRDNAAPSPLSSSLGMHGQTLPGSTSRMQEYGSGTYLSETKRDELRNWGNSCSGRQKGVGPQTFHRYTCSVEPEETSSWERQLTPQDWDGRDMDSSKQSDRTMTVELLSETTPRTSSTRGSDAGTKRRAMNTSECTDASEMVDEAANARPARKRRRTKNPDGCSQDSDSSEQTRQSVFDDDEIQPHENMGDLNSDTQSIARNLQPRSTNVSRDEPHSYQTTPTSEASTVKAVQVLPIRQKNSSDDNERQAQILPQSIPRGASPTFADVPFQQNDPDDDEIPTRANPHSPTTKTSTPGLETAIQHGCEVTEGSTGHSSPGMFVRDTPSTPERHSDLDEYWIDGRVASQKPVVEDVTRPGDVRTAQAELYAQSGIKANSTPVSNESFPPPSQIASQDSTPEPACIPLPRPPSHYKTPNQLQQKRQYPQPTAIETSTSSSSPFKPLSQPRFPSNQFRSHPQYQPRLQNGAQQQEEDSDPGEQTGLGTLRQFRKLHKIRMGLMKEREARGKNWEEEQSRREAGENRQREGAFFPSWILSMSMYGKKAANSSTPSSQAQQQFQPQNTSQPQQYQFAGPSPFHAPSPKITAYPATLLSALASSLTEDAPVTSIYLQTQRARRQRECSFAQLLEALQERISYPLSQISLLPTPELRSFFGYSQYLRERAQEAEEVNGELLMREEEFKKRTNALAAMVRGLEEDVVRLSREGRELRARLR
ncbi:hypothetical protein BP5796_09950 [Coleophoma crateriformis]|uniref:Uncharacterized protein n=1 Tax=Coleophoma crateriformis TaxID=565419 RepID=A0A3D8QU96_9HELO|nr:hypothetical protein BP5796_09950 [Coleophoma crateriformis]